MRVGVVFCFGLYLCWFGAQADYISSPDETNYCQSKLAQEQEHKRIQKHMTDGYTLVQTQMIIRHGDRTPNDWFESPTFNDTAVWNCSTHRLTDISIGHNSHNKTQNRLTLEKYMPNREANRGNCRLGALTTKGMKQLLRNGEKSRALYVETAKLLPKTWDEDAVYIRSGDEPLLVESAQSFLIGLYPTEKTTTQNQRQSIDLIDQAYDNMSPDILNVCGRGQQLKEKAHTLPAWTNLVTKRDALTRQLQDIFHVEVSVNSMADLIRTRKCHEFDETFGGLLSQELVKDILEISLLELIHFPNDEESNRMGMGTFLWEMFRFFQAHVEEKNTYKFLLFSAHDKTIWSLLNALELFDGVWPPLGSTLTFEFWKDTKGEYFIEIVYNGRSITKLRHGCGDPLCSWTKFFKKTSSTTVHLDHFWKLCHTPLSSSS